MSNVTQTGGTFLDKAVDVIIPPEILSFLNTTIYRNPLILLNYWSFVHLFAGILFYIFFPKKLKLWIWINIIFEVIEYVLGLGGNPLFVEETIDTLLDIVWSVGGFITAKYSKEKMWPIIQKKILK